MPISDKELQGIVNGLIIGVKERLAEELAPLVTRIAVVEAKSPRDGRDGRDADPTQFLALQAKVELLEAKLEALTRGRRASNKGGDDDAWLSSLPVT